MNGAAGREPRPTPSPVPQEADTPSGPSLGVPIDIRSIALTIIAVLALVVMLRYAEGVLIPIVLGILINYALEPVVARLTTLRIPRPIAAAIVLLTMVGVTGTLAYQLRWQVEAIARDLPDAARRLRQTFERRDAQAGPTAIEQVQEAATELEKAADAAAPPEKPGVTRVQVEEPQFNVSAYVVWGSIGIATALAQMVMVLFLAYFLLASGDLFRRKLVKIAGPSLTKKKITLQILEEIDRQIAWFLLVQVFTSIIVGVASWLFFLWMGLEQAAVWGLLAGVFNSIPYFGPVLVTASMGVIAYLQFGDIQQSLYTAGGAFVITTLEGMLLTPWLTSRAARMNAVAIFVGLLFWGWVWQVWGVLLAVPMLMALKAVCDRVEDFKNAGELLGD